MFANCNSLAIYTAKVGLKVESSTEERTAVQLVVQIKPAARHTGHTPGLYTRVSRKIKGKSGKAEPFFQMRYKYFTPFQYFLKYVFRTFMGFKFYVTGLNSPDVSIPTTFVSSQCLYTVCFAYFVPTYFERNLSLRTETDKKTTLSL